MPSVQETTLAISLKALENNYTYLRSKIPETSQFMGVVKAYAYGSDALEVGRKLVTLGAEYLAVSYTREGVALRESGISVPILVFHPQPVQFRQIIACKLIPTLYNKRTFQAFIEIAQEMELIHYPVHLNLNTGMNRLGFGPAALKAVAAAVQKTEAITVEGIYSHFVASEDPNEKDFTRLQIRRFHEMCRMLTEKLPNRPLLHLCNTSGILNYPEAHLDMVRAGIGLYGYGNSSEEDKNLIPVSTLKTPITQIHHLKKGETAGYNRKFIAQKACRIGVLELGYADGLYRAYGNGKMKVLVRGRKAPLAGNICMGMAMVDITEIECKEGDEAIIFGVEHPAADVAKSIQTISYELITGISQRVKRIVYKK